MTTKTKRSKLLDMLISGEDVSRHNLEVKDVLDACGKLTDAYAQLLGMLPEEMVPDELCTFFYDLCQNPETTVVPSMLQAVSNGLAADMTPVESATNATPAS